MTLETAIQLQLGSMTVRVLQLQLDVERLQAVVDRLTPKTKKPATEAK